MTEAGRTSRLYVDSNVFIYALDGPDAVAAQIQKLFVVLQANAGLAVTSELTLAEVLPKAASWQKRYYLNLIIWSRIFDLQPISRDILIETTNYRTAAGMPKLPDAVHVVTAIRSRCTRMLSNDRRLQLPDGYTLIHPDAQSLSRLIEELS